MDSQVSGLSGRKNLKVFGVQVQMRGAPRPTTRETGHHLNVERPNADEGDGVDYPPRHADVIQEEGPRNPQRLAPVVVTVLVGDGESKLRGRGEGRHKMLCCYTFKKLSAFGQYELPNPSFKSHAKIESCERTLLTKRAPSNRSDLQQ
jgi:hypothetical protein